MTSTQTEIYNRALSMVGGRSSVDSPDEISLEANTCNLWWPQVRGLVLGAAMWPSTTATARLSVLASRDFDADWVSGDPLPQYAYAYGVPNDMLRPRYFSGFASFQLSRIGSNRAIMTNDANGLFVYTADVLNVALWDTELVQAVTETLAAAICMKMTGSRQKMLTQFQLAQGRIMDARVAAANMLRQSYDFMPASLAARGGAVVSPDLQYVFPNGEFSLGGVSSVN